MKRILALAAALLASGSAPAQHLCTNADVQRAAACQGAPVAYEEAPATDPGSSEAATNLASIYHLSGQNEKSIAAALEAKK